MADPCKDENPQLEIIKILSSDIRKKTLLALRDGTIRFSELMRECELDTNSDTGLFLYHLHALRRMGAVQGRDGRYWITPLGVTAVDWLAERTNKGRRGGVGLGTLDDIDWSSFRTPMPTVVIDRTDRAFELKVGSVVGMIGAERVDLMDITEVTESGSIGTRFPSLRPLLVRRYAMPEEELYAFAIQRFTGKAKIGGEDCVESTRTYHDPDGVLLAKIVQWFAKRKDGIWMKKLVSVDLANDKPTSTSEKEMCVTPFLPLNQNGISKMKEKYVLRVDRREEVAIRLVDEIPSLPVRWESYMTNGDLSVTEMYTLDVEQKTQIRDPESDEEWELGEVSIAQKI